MATTIETPKFYTQETSQRYYYINNATLAGIESNDNNVFELSYIPTFVCERSIPCETIPSSADVRYSLRSGHSDFATLPFSDNRPGGIYYNFESDDHPVLDFEADDPVAFLQVDLDSPDLPQSVPSLANLCLDVVDKKKQFCNRFVDFNNYNLIYDNFSTPKTLSQIKTLSFKMLLNAHKLDLTRQCVGCKACLTTFRSIEEHVNYHLTLMRPLTNQVDYVRDSFSRMISCFSELFDNAPRYLRQCVMNRDRICQSCRCYYNSFMSLRTHHDFHITMRDILLYPVCNRCWTRFDNVEDRLKHFWAHREERHASRKYVNSTFENPGVFRLTDVTVPFASECDVKIMKDTKPYSSAYSNYRWFAQVARKRNMWKQYKIALNKMKKNDSGKMLANLLAIDSRRDTLFKGQAFADYVQSKAFERDVTKAMASFSVGQPEKMFNRMRDCNDTYPQFFDNNRIFGADFSVLPKDLCSSVLKMIQDVFANIGDWLKTIWKWISDYYVQFGLLALVVAIVIVWKLVSLLGCTTREVVLSGSALAVALVCYYDACAAEDMAAQVMDIVEDLKKHPTQFHFGPPGTDLTTGAECDIPGYDTSLDSTELIKDSNDTIAHLGNDDNDAFAMTTMLARFLKLKVEPDSIKKFISFNRLSYNMASGLRSWTFMIDWIKNAAVKLVDSFYGTADERKIMSFDAYKDMSRRWIKEIGELDTEEMRKSISYDESSQMRALNVRDIGTHLLEMSISTKQHSSVRSAINVMLKTARELAELAEKAVMSNDMRADPWLIWLYGEPGIGKSAAVQLICNMLLEGYSQRLKNRTYAINGSLKHMDGYKSQPMVLIDDFLTMADSQHETESLDIFMKCKSATCYQVPMAAIQEKGKNFDSPLMMVTSNQLYPNITTRVHNTEAVYRRRNALWSAMLKPEYAGKSMAEIPLEVSMKMHHMCFQEYHPIKINQKIGLPVEFEDFVDKCRRAIAAHFTLQKALLMRAGQHVPHILRHIRNKRVLEGNLGDVTTGAPEFINFDDFDESDDSGTVYHADESLHENRIPEHVVQWTDDDHKDALIRIKRSIASCNRFFEPAKKQLEKILSMCSGWAAKCADYIKQRPLLAAICGIGVGATVFLGLKAMMKAVFGKDVQPEMAASGSYKTKFLNRPAVGQRQYAARKVISEGRTISQSIPLDIAAEGCSDQNAMELMTQRLPWNLFDISRHEKNGTMLTMRATSLCGRIIILPAHFFVGVEKDQLITLSDGLTKWTDMFNPSRLVLIDDENGQLDIAAYEMGPVFPMQRKLTAHFITEKELGRIGTTEGTLLHRAPGFSGVAETNGVWGMSAKVTPIDKMQNLFYDVNKNNASQLFTLRTGWNFHGPTREGDCGSLLVVHCPSVKGKIIGMHVAGSRSKTLGYSMVVTQEIINELVRLCTTRGLSVEPPPTEIFDQGKEVPSIFPNGNFTHYGVVKSEYQVHQPTKTAIAPSLIFDKVRAHVCEPACLRENDPRNLSGMSPLQQGIDKYGTPTKQFPRRLLKFAAREVFNTYAELDWPAQNNVVEMQWTLCGSGDGSNAINLNTSAGHPWVCKKPKDAKGKHWLLENDGCGNVTMTSEMEAAVCDRLDKYARGIRPFEAWTDCKKDEIRPLAKIEAGKTRIFTIAPVDFTIVCRMFFLHFIEAFQRNNCKGFSAVGLDPLVDWERMFKRMEEVGTKCAFDGDFGTYDGSLKPDCINESVDSISDWYDMHVDGLTIVVSENKIYHFTAEQCRVIRSLIADAIIHTNQLVRDCLYQSHQGNPSGNPLTAILNSKVNALYLRIVFYLCVGKCELGLFGKTVREEVYGDDNIVNVREDFAELFNFQTVSKTLAEYGIEYTTADKQKGDSLFKYKPLKDLRFLKQGVGLYKNCVRVPLMDKNTIYELTNWVSTKMPPIDQLYDNLDCALRYMALYGKQDFDLFKKDVNDALYSIGLTRVMMDYESFSIELDQKLGLN